MADNELAFSNRDVRYYPYLESKPGASLKALAALAAKSTIVVSDDFPCSFVHRMVKSAIDQIDMRFELIDSNGLYPMRETFRIFSRAIDFRRHLQKNLLPHLAKMPQLNPLARLKLPKLDLLPSDFARKWPQPDLAVMTTKPGMLSAYPIDHSVSPVSVSGGAAAAIRQLRSFIQHRLSNYKDQRNQPERNVTSQLSPYLHFGHLSAHQVFSEVTKAAQWNPSLVAPKASGRASGWWGTDENTESFLDELITWRELGYNMCHLAGNYDQFESLPVWAQKTLDDHTADRRPVVYSLEQFEQFRTHDPLWNAAQSQLVREGTIHNYLRMLWGKKILEWSSSPREALTTMIHLNNKYAIDGHNPNSYSGILWVLGRYDRPWGPARPIFGTIRYMSSENTARKFSVKNYIEKHLPPARGN